MYEHRVFSKIPLETLTVTACCAAHAELPAPDHVVMSSSFVVDDQDHDGETIPAQRFAVVVLVDGKALERGVELTPQITMTILDQFAAMIREAVGEEHMGQVMLCKIIDQFGAEVMENEPPEPNERRGITSPFPRGFNVQMRRRGDRQH